MRALFLIDDYIIDPLGIAWLSAYLKDAGHETRIYKTKYKHTFSAIEEYQPDILCYSVTTGKHIFFRDLNNKIKKEYKCPSLFGGPHITFFPQFCEEEGVDIGVRGEGFAAIVDIVNALSSGNDISSIHNVVLKDRQNPLRPLKDKNDLLLPDRALIYQFPENYNNPIKNIMCSWECPGNCPYCYNPRYKELYGRRVAEIRNVDNVLAEFDDLLNYPLKMVFFQDDIFPLYKKGWIYEFAEKYREYKIPFHIQTRIEMVDTEIIRMLKSVGLYSLTFAIESGNEEIRERILNRGMSNELILSKVKILHDEGIKFRSENMIGIPGGNIDTALETLDLNIKCNPTIAWASLFQPYPGTELGDKCLKEGLFSGNLDDISGSFFDTYRLNENAKLYQRLQKIFAFVVKYKWLRPFVKILIRLPLNSIYNTMFKRLKSKLYAELYNITN